MEAIKNGEFHSLKFRAQKYEFYWIETLLWDKFFPWAYNWFHIIIFDYFCGCKSKVFRWNLFPLHLVYGKFVQFNKSLWLFSQPFEFEGWVRIAQRLKKSKKISIFAAACSYVFRHQEPRQISETLWKTSVGDKGLNLKQFPCLKRCHRWRLSKGFLICGTGSREPQVRINEVHDFLCQFLIHISTKPNYYEKNHVFIVQCNPIISLHEMLRLC